MQSSVGNGASNGGLAVLPGGGGRQWAWPAIVAVVVALAALGVAVWALVSVPAVGPSGAQGPQGPQGAQGVQGIAGSQGVAGPQGALGKQGLPGRTGATGRQGSAGPVGTVRAASVVSSTALVSGPNPPLGSVLVAKTTCPAGKVLMGGGAQVSAPGAADRSVELRSSFPLNSYTWQTVSLVTAALGGDAKMTMKPFVLCGTP